MNGKHETQHTHGHMMWVGILGLAGGTTLLIYVPSLHVISRATVLFAGFHLVGAVVLLASIYVMRGRRIATRIAVPCDKQDQARPDFGWASAWIYGPWIAALILVSTAVALQETVPGYWMLSFLAIALAASFFAGGLITRTTPEYSHAVLPMVDLLLADQEGQLVLDAGCGAGRTTLALGRAVKKTRIVALDRFDSDYIEGGGRTLLERNLQIAGMTKRVEIERGDLTSLPFPNQTFDAAISAHAMDHLGEKTEPGLREVLRVLKPGGRFLLIVWVPGWTMFAVASILAFSLSPKRAWRRMAARAGFTVADEGMFNGYWFALLKKPEAE